MRDLLKDCDEGRGRLTVDVPTTGHGHVRRKAKWDRDDKTAAVQHYILWADTHRMQKDLGIPKQTVESWMETEWWPGLLEAAKLEKQEELDARFTKLLHSALDELDDRVRLGDHKLHARTGDIVRVPVPGKDLSSIANNIFDKRQLLRGDATTIASKKIENTKDLEAKFLQIAKDLQGKDVIADQEAIEVHEIPTTDD